MLDIAIFDLEQFPVLTIVGKEAPPRLAFSNSLRPTPFVFVAFQLTNATLLSTTTCMAEPNDLFFTKQRLSLYTIYIMHC